MTFFKTIAISALLLTASLAASQPWFSSQNCCLEKYKKHLVNTTWVVPPQTLLAYYYVDGAPVPVSDQTVWVITRFDGGYFFGKSYSSFDQVPTSEKSLVGSVTPEGDVYITFYTIEEISDVDVVDGVGKFQKKDGKYFFTMQMNSASNGVSGLSHWSYMIPVKPGDPFYINLPGENMSVPQFISQF